MADSSFSSVLGYVYLFNLIVGTGTLALPRAFQDAGYILATCVIAALSFFSYLAFTFVVESMSIANALLSRRKTLNNNRRTSMVTESGNDSVDDQHGNDSGESQTIDFEIRRRIEVPRDQSRADRHCDIDPLLDESRNENGESSGIDFEIKRRIEVGTMASLFLGKSGVYAFYACLIVYLYGDLAIYSTVVPKSLMNVICTVGAPIEVNSTCLFCNVSKYDPCWQHSNSYLTRFAIYRLIVAGFALLIGPFVFFNLSKTKYLQLFTNVSRWTSFLLMIGVACKLLLAGQGAGRPLAFKMEHFADLFGISVYAFMCHHSLPSVITPMKNKAGIFRFASMIYGVILAFYITISLTGSFAFHKVQDVYTLNFLSLSGASSGSVYIVISIIDYYLALFPVFTLTTNFPIVGVTLRNNIIDLLYNDSIRDSKFSSLQQESGLHRDYASEQNNDDDIGGSSQRPDSCASDASLYPSVGSKNEETRRTFVIKRVLIPILVVLPPTFVSLSTDNVELLTSVTGSYAGVGVQYVLPALLIWGARKSYSNPEFSITPTSQVSNAYASPFARNAWIIVLLCWAVLSVTIVTVNHAYSGF